MEIDQNNTWKLRTARFIANAIIAAQVRASLALNRWERKCTIKQKKVMFALFLCVGAGYCSYLLADGLCGQPETNNAVWEHGTPHTPHLLIPPISVDSTHSLKNQ